MKTGALPSPVSYDVAMPAHSRAACRRSALAALLISPSFAHGQAATLGPPFYALQPGVPKVAPIDTTALRRDVDEFMAKDMAELKVPGAVVAVVQDGRIIFLKGYGLADSATRRPVDALRTVFRLGSITKVITATAVMRLVEEGKIQLHADVNRYLKGFQVPDRFDRPVTVHDLLTHTAGFDVRLNGTAARTEAEVQSLATYLSRDLPPRVRKPGEVYAYSNHGYTLLGAVIESVTGEPYETYVRRSILDPLEMRGASLRFDGSTSANAATGYEPRGYSHKLAPVVYPNIAPAASLNGTAVDMARYMIAMLEGESGTPRAPIADATRALMFAPHFRQDPRVPGMTYGFMESFWRGQRLLFHSGGVHGFMSLMYLWPDQRLGLFVADNGYRGDLLFDLGFHFMEREFPYAKGLAPVSPDAAARVGKFAGYYQLARHSVTNLERAGAIRNSPLEVKAAGDGTLSVFGETFVEVAPRLFRNAGSETLAFLENEQGDVTGVATTYPFQGNDVYLKIPFWRTDIAAQLLLILTAVVSLVVALRPPGHSRGFSLRAAGVPATATRTSAMARNVAVLALIFMVLMWIGFRAAGPAGTQFGIPWPMDAAGIVGIVLVAGVVALSVAVIGEIRARRVGGAARVQLAAFTVLMAVFCVGLWSWNLVGIRH